VAKEEPAPHEERGGLRDDLRYGVYSSALSNSLTASLPPALTTLPLWSTVEVWPEHRHGGLTIAEIQEFVFQNMEASGCSVGRR
jgi:hypothetical protein